MARLEDTKFRKLIAEAGRYGLTLGGLHEVTWVMHAADHEAHEILTEAIRWLWDESLAGSFDYTGIASVTWNARWRFWFTDADTAFAFKMRWC